MLGFFALLMLAGQSIELDGFTTLPCHVQIMDLATVSAFEAAEDAIQREPLDDQSSIESWAYWRDQIEKMITDPPSPDNSVCLDIQVIPRGNKNGYLFDNEAFNREQLSNVIALVFADRLYRDITFQFPPDTPLGDDLRFAERMPYSEVFELAAELNAFYGLSWGEGIEKEEKTKDD